jgi:two-component system nitrate/nitrite sensor histidine kinase NarX
MVLRFWENRKNWPWLLGLILYLAVSAWLSSVVGWFAAAGWLLAVLALGGAVYFFADAASREKIAQSRQSELLRTQERLQETEAARKENERRLSTILKFNRSLADAAAGLLDERALMDHALSSITGLVGALGCSYVPVDDWQQPLPAFTYGQLPEPVLNAWSTHLATRMLHERCGACKILASNPGACPLHPAEVGNALSVFCLPFSRANQPGTPGLQNQALARQSLSVTSGSKTQTAGVLHLYLPTGHTLDADTRVFLDGMLNEITMAYEAIRLRSQEQMTLRQLQMLHSPENDFVTSLGGILEALQQALEADIVQIRLRPSADERFSNLNVRRGIERSENRLDERMMLQALNSALQGLSDESAPGTLPVWVSLPLVLPESLPADVDASGSHGLQKFPLGVLVAAVHHPYVFHPRQQAILQTVAAQAALLIENERMLRSLEYKVVIQERIRLAREIHDGLAQTLAFLKLQAAQMQSYLAQGNLDRLSQVLKDNYQALAEAYLDTRQAIDNLRLTPQDDLQQWLERILTEFEATTGVTVESNIQSLSRPVPPEIQAQLVRIVQEALSNIRKHARANKVWLQLREWQNEQVLEVTDDGAGFDSEDVPEASQHGLRGMRERAELIGADFQIISQAHQGTTVRLTLPISFKEEASS